MTSASSNRRSTFKSMGTILVFGLVMAIGMIVTMTISAVSVDKVRVGGAAYNEVIQVKDLVADILPPPLYIIEAYLEANLAFNRNRPMNETKSRLAELRKQYDERWNYWVASNLGASIKSKLTESSHAQALKFWTAVTDKMLPAIEADQAPQARAGFDEMTKAYEAHRKVIDDIVADADTLGKKIEATTAQQTMFALWSIAIAAAALFILLVVGLVMITRRLVTPLGAMGDGLARLSDGNLTQKMTQTVPPEYRQLQDNYNSAVEKLQEILASVKSSAQEVTNASAEISTSTSDLSQRTEEQAASLEETSAAMEEISSTVKNNAENARQASNSAASTQGVADRGGKVVAQAIDAMAKIEESSRKISDIIGVIDEIARQTNLLALNAAVEAARAGEAGRGFAVVASEVRSLAQRSSQAAKDIKDLIVNSNEQVKDGVELVNRAGASLNEIVESIKSVATVVSDIANASMEQSTGIDQINKALTQMDEATQQNSALVEENAATAKTLENQAKSMGEQIEFFKVDPGASDRESAGARSGHAPQPRNQPRSKAA